MPDTESAAPTTPQKRRLFPAILISAFLMTLAFPAPDLGWLAWIGLAPLCWALPRARRPRHAFALGYLFGITHWGTTIYWIGTTVSAWTHSAAGWIAWILLTLIKSLWFALFGVLVWWIGKRFRSSESAKFIARPVAIASAWTMVEWLRCQSSVAMPWSLSGYTQYRYLPVIQAADLAGVFIITFALGWMGAALAEVIASYIDSNGDIRRNRAESIRAAFPPLLLLGFMLVYGAFALHRSYDGQSMRLALIQPNLASRRGDEYALQRDLAMYRSLAGRIQPGSVDLVVWPESTVSRYFDEPPSQETFGEFANRLQAYQLLGSSYVDSRGQVYNSAMLVAPNGNVDRYDKNWLVPMGEWVVMRPLLQPFDSVFHFPPDTVAGRQDSVMQAGKAKMSVLICYESVFPIVSRTRSRNGANLLVGITNDSWAGESSELQQHVAMAALRAVENRRWLASSATTGITGLISPTGRIDALQPYKEDVYTGTVQLRTEVTVYARFGDWLVALCGIVVAWALFGGKRGKATESVGDGKL